MAKTKPPVMVVVTGPPAAGKTTIATALRAELGLPLVAKDALKEALAGPLGVEGRPASQRLGRAVLVAMGLLVHELVDAGVSLIVEGKFATADIFAELRARFVQVHVSAPPAMIRERLLARAGRHPVHYDAGAAEEIAARSGRGEWEPLPLGGPVVRVDTTEPADLATVVREVGTLVAE